MNGFLERISGYDTFPENAAFFLIYFSLCAFLGWIIELLYRSLKGKRFINPGFLYGPFVPIYGFSAVFFTVIDSLLSGTALTLRLVMLLLLPAVMEYITSYVLEKTLSLKLWDYSDRKFNVNGRICPSFSFIWFVLGLVYIYFLQPLFLKLLKMIPAPVLPAAAGILLLYFAVDTGFTIKLHSRIKRVRSKMKELFIRGRKINLDTLFLHNPALTGLRIFLKPSNKYPNLMFSFEKELAAMTAGIIESKLFQNGRFFDYSGDTEFLDIIEEVIRHPEYEKLKEIHHHENNIYTHSIHVSWISYRIGKYLRGYIPLDLRALTRGALLHDFFLYDWRTERPANGKRHAFEHPKEAYRNAVRYFSTVSSVEKDIILKHMWPLTVIPPKYLETLIVIMVDKIVASKEIFKEISGR